MASFESCFKKLTAEPVPEVIYIDTSFWITLLVKDKRYNKQAIEFMERLEKADTMVITSTITIVELRCAILCIYVKNHIASVKQTPYEKIKATEEIKKDPELINKFYPEIENAEKVFFAIWNRFKNRLFIPLENVMPSSGKIMGKYRLASYDAVHIASMEYVGGVKDIAVIDKDIEDLPRYKGECYIWTVGGWDKYKKRHLSRLRYS
jgi:predicted nucleic acid-binding protein